MGFSSSNCILSNHTWALRSPPGEVATRGQALAAVPRTTLSISAAQQRLAAPARQLEPSRSRGKHRRRENTSAPKPRAPVRRPLTGDRCLRQRQKLPDWECRAGPLVRGMPPCKCAKSSAVIVLRASKSYLQTRLHSSLCSAARSSDA